MRRLTRRMTALYDHELAPTGLRLTQYSLLATLCREGGQTGITLSELAAVMEMDRTTLTRNLRPLVQQQLISVGLDAADGRARRAQLTAQGGAVFEAAQPFWHTAQSFVNATLGQENVAALHGSVDSAISALRGEHQGKKA